MGMGIMHRDVTLVPLVMQIADEDHPTVCGAVL